MKRIYWLTFAELVGRPHTAVCPFCLHRCHVKKVKIIRIYLSHLGIQEINMNEVNSWAFCYCADCLGRFSYSSTQLSRLFHWVSFKSLATRIHLHSITPKKFTKKVLPFTINLNMFPFLCLFHNKHKWMSKLKDLDKQMTTTRLRQHVHALRPAKKALGIPSREMANKLADGIPSSHPHARSATPFKNSPKTQVLMGHYSIETLRDSLVHSPLSLLLCQPWWMASNDSLLCTQGLPPSRQLFAPSPALSPS